MEIKIFSEMSKEYKEFGKTEWLIADIEHYGSPSGWKDEHFFLEAKIGKNVAGTLHLKCTSGVVYIESIIVGQKYRRQGVGQSLMKEAEKQSRKLGAHKIFLDTGKGWQSEEFYRKLGYEVTGEHLKHYNGHDFVIFTKFLN